MQIPSCLLLLRLIDQGRSL